MERLHIANEEKLLMKLRIPTTVLIFLIGLSSMNRLTAHHGLDEFDTTVVIELKGTVVGFELIDPHSLLYVDVQNQDGTTTAWVIEGGAAHGVVSAGLTKESLTLRPTVIVRGYQSKDKQCTPHCKANGRDFVFE